MLLPALSGIIYAQDNAPDCRQESQWDRLIKKEGAPVRELLNKPTFYREAEIKGLPCSVSDFEFLLDRPSTSVALAGRVHKSLDHYQIEEKRPGVFHVEDAPELSGDLEVLTNRAGEKVYYLVGYWKPVLGMKLRGRLALVLDYNEKGSGSGKAVDAKARGYILIENAVVSAAFRAVAYMFPKKIDARIDRFATAVSKVICAVHDDPESACKWVDSAPHVSRHEAREFRERFSAGKI